MPQEKAKKKGKKTLTGRWSHAENERFLNGLEKFGKNWVQVQKTVKTRTLAQVRSHAQKYLKKINLKDFSFFIDNTYSEVHEGLSNIIETQHFQNFSIHSATDPAKEEDIGTSFKPLKKQNYPTNRQSLIEKMPIVDQRSIFTQLLSHHKQHFLKGGTFMDLIIDPQKNIDDFKR